MSIIFKLRQFAAVSCVLIFVVAGLTYSKTEIPAISQNRVYQSQTAKIPEPIPFVNSDAKLPVPEQPDVMKNLAEATAIQPAPLPAESPKPVEQKKPDLPHTWIGTITTDGVNFRKSPEKADNILGMMNEGQVVTVFSSSGEWYRVKTTNDTYGWVSSGFVKEGVTLASRGTSRQASKPAPTPVKPSNTKTAVSVAQPAPSAAKPATGSNTASLGQQLVSYAKKYMGVPYVWGGETPDGFDCSGFMQYVYGHFAIRLDRVAADQAKQGKKVPKAELIPGDLIFFDTNGTQSYINHVGMYIGGGNFINAASGAKKVIIRELNNGFYKDKFMTARRVTK